MFLASFRRKLQLPV